MEAQETVLVHKWQEKGLGIAPFEVAALISTPSKSLQEHNPMAFNSAYAEASRSASHFGVGLGSCDACGQCLQNNFVIRDSKGKHFVVGCDCVAKTYDTKLMAKVEYMEKKRKDEVKKAKWEAARQERMEKQQAEEKAQRERNGGLTDYELTQKQREEEEQKKASVFTEENGWLIEVLTALPYASDFVDGMVKELSRGSLKDLSERCQNILMDIYSKSFGRRGSKQYKAAETAFESKLGRE